MPINPEPTEGFEPTTCCLQNSYSTAELCRQIKLQGPSVVLAKEGVKEILTKRSLKVECFKSDGWRRGLSSG